MQRYLVVLLAGLLLAFPVLAHPPPPPETHQKPPPETLYPLLEPDTKNGFNFHLKELFAAGKKATWTTAPKTAHEVDVAVAGIEKGLGRGGGDHGNAVRAAVREHVEFANKRNYDITDTLVQKKLTDVIVAIVSDNYTTTMAHFRGEWRGGGFGK